MLNKTSKYEIGETVVHVPTKRLMAIRDILTLMKLGTGETEYLFLCVGESDEYKIYKECEIATYKPNYKPLLKRGMTLTFTDPIRTYNALKDNWSWNFTEIIENGDGTFTMIYDDDYLEYSELHYEEQKKRVEEKFKNKKTI